MAVDIARRTRGINSTAFTPPSKLIFENALNIFGKPNDRAENTPPINIAVIA